MTHSISINALGVTITVSAPSEAGLAQLIAVLKGDARPSEQPPAAPAAEVQQPKASKPAPPSAAVSAEEKAAVTGKPASTPARPAPAPPAPTPPTAPAAPAAAQPPSATYDDVKKVINALYVIDPQHAVDLLAEAGVKNGKELKPEQWAGVVASGKAQLEALQVPA